MSSVPSVLLQLASPEGGGRKPARVQHGKKEECQVRCREHHKVKLVVSAAHKSSGVFEHIKTHMSLDCGNPYYIMYHIMCYLGISLPKLAHRQQLRC